MTLARSPGCTETDYVRFIDDIDIPDTGMNMTNTANNVVVAIFSLQLKAIMNFIYDVLRELQNNTCVSDYVKTRKVLPQKISELSKCECEYLIKHLDTLKLEPGSTSVLSEIVKEIRNYCISNINSQKHV